jgi:formylglycine-generating enzyme required for sulfatase activity
MKYLPQVIVGFVINLIMAACTQAIIPTPAPGAVENGMVYIPEGEFIMGTDKPAVCQHLCEEDQDVGPARKVHTAAYWIGVNEITNGEYLKCEEAGACTPPKVDDSAGRANYHTSPEFTNYPVTYVTWDQAQTYCEWQGKRLPTEAEWERAARGDEGQLYPWGTEYDPDKYHEYELRSTNTYSIGQYNDATAWGIYDAAGNAWEWTADWYAPYQDPHQPPDDGVFKIIRGGAWRGYAFYFRYTARLQAPPALAGRFVGIRCAKDAK